MWIEMLMFIVGKKKKKRGGVKPPLRVIFIVMPV